MRQIFDHRETVMGLRRLARAVCESVRARRRDGAGSLLTLGIRSLRCLHTHWRGRSMRQIFDHRETVMGLRRLARAVCQGVRARRRDGEGSLLTFGSRPSRCLHASWRGRSTRRTLEHREAVVGRCPRQRKVCDSVGERRCDVSGSLVTFRFRLHRRLHTSWRGWWAPQIFRHRETVLGLCRWPRAVCESVGERDGATAQAVCGPWVFPVTPLRAHILARAVDVTDFATEKWCWDCAGGRAQSARVSESDCETGQAVCRPCVSSHTDACSHLGGRWT